ncbi:MAG: UDP-N-acetylglucosamine--N-acetylmuramyl-(pentapeptide) pyrophosphoryl-undecaprenol N-acetylglucosamine transferase [Chloroflexi bacterium]|nr:UDP-N-acetylglucosamine--N-acetylmuramyl-(pentapeptide) pyrophosphoryl-undecaprenol N-acetylglucosamine transferase [Chloroflexota bacterium]
MRLMICAGASGGGVYPALAVLQALNEGEADLLWVGGEGGMEAALVQRAGLAFTAIPAGQVNAVGLRAILGVFQLARGYFAARGLVRRFRPDALLFTGGFVSVPVGLAGRRLPILLCLPDIEPARALQLISRYAAAVAAPAEDSRSYFRPGLRVEVTGYPVRADLAGWDRTRAAGEFGLDPGLPTLLVFGGSKGARSINLALVKGLPALLPEMQVLHVTGEATWEETRAARPHLPGELLDRYRAYPYLHATMGAAFAAADLAVCRAGASTLGELPLFGLPAILVPLPHFWRYQEVNAGYLARQGGAVVLADADLEAKLTATVLDLMHNKPGRLAMQAALHKLARPQAAAEIAGLLRELAARQG